MPEITDVIKKQDIKKKLLQKRKSQVEIPHLFIFGALVEKEPLQLSPN